MVVAPEHPLLPGLAAESERQAVEAYVQAAASKSDLERTELQKVKTGVPTGVPRSSELLVVICMSGVGCAGHLLPFRLPDSGNVA